TAVLTSTYDAVGNLLTAKNAQGTYTLSYDALNRVASVYEPFGQSLFWDYNTVGNRTQIRDNRGFYHDQIYDAIDRVTNVELYDLNLVWLGVDVTYDALDHIQTLSRWNEGVSTYYYDYNYRPTYIQHVDAYSTLIGEFGYAYDAAGRLTLQYDNGTNTTLTYDNADQLTADSLNTYTYDGAGNRNNGS